MYMKQIYLIKYLSKCFFGLSLCLNEQLAYTLKIEHVIKIFYLNQKSFGV